MADVYPGYVSPAFAPIRALAEQVTAQVRVSQRPVPSLLVTWLALWPHLLEGLPPAEQNRIRRARFQTAARTALYVRALHEALAALAEAGVTPVLLKAAAFLVTGAYPDPGLRPMADLDLWVVPAEMPRAWAAVRRLGYRPVPKARRPLAMRMRYRQEIELVAPAAAGKALDLHFRPFQGVWARLVARIPQRSLWQRRHVGVWQGVPYARLAPEDHVLHLAYHWVVNHHFALPGAQALLDIPVSLSTWPVSWETVIRRARSWRIATVAWAAFSRVRLCFPEVVPPEVVRDLAPPEPRRRLLARLLPSRQALLSPPHTVGRRRYLLYLVLCDDPRGRWRLLTWAFWPDLPWMKARYGRAGLGARVHHVGRVLTQPRF